MNENPLEVPRRFDRVAGTYDLLTGLNPGYHRALAVSAGRLALNEREPTRLLDLCAGTGASTAALRSRWPRAEIVALDGSPGMLERGRHRFRNDPSISWVLGDATDPAAAGVEGQFDGILMAYGIRNLADPDRALDNIRLLLRPGARAVFHEYSVQDSPRAKLIWKLVCQGIIVPGGLLTAPDSDIYRYLYRSVLAFDGKQGFVERLRRVGFEDVWVGSVSGWQRGIVHSFVGRRR